MDFAREKERLRDLWLMRAAANVAFCPVAYLLLAGMVPSSSKGHLGCGFAALPQAMGAAFVALATLLVAALCFSTSNQFRWRGSRTKILDATTLLLPLSPWGPYVLRKTLEALTAPGSQHEFD
ncbi:MAG: hypothetical protein JSS66_02635 [Armatimonadetes bacterium]|nr:hypothetical protein [Armatimonadota bacterium]